MGLFVLTMRLFAACCVAFLDGALVHHFIGVAPFARYSLHSVKRRWQVLRFAVTPCMSAALALLTCSSLCDHAKEKKVQCRCHFQERNREADKMNLAHMLSRLAVFLQLYQSM